MVLNLSRQLEATHDQGVDHEHIERENEPKESHVVQCTNAGSKPDTVMVEAAHTVVAVMAVRGLLRPENETSLAELEPAKKGIGLAGAMCCFTLRHDILEAILRLEDACVLGLEPGASLK